MDNMVSDVSHQLSKAYMLSKDKMIADAILRVWPEFTIDNPHAKDRLQCCIAPDKSETYAVDGVPIITFYGTEFVMDGTKLKITQQYKLY